MIGAMSLPMPPLVAEPCLPIRDRDPRPPCPSQLGSPSPMKGDREWEGLPPRMATNNGLPPFNLR